MNTIAQKLALALAEIKNERDSCHCTATSPNINGDLCGDTFTCAMCLKRNRLTKLIDTLEKPLVYAHRHTLKPFQDLTGRKFTEWTVIKYDEEKKYRWVCQCSCGVTKSVVTQALLNGTSKSCGHSHRTHLTVEYKGQIMSVKEAARLSGINYPTLKYRVIQQVPKELLYLPAKNY